jgi:hypothetical protein
VLGWGWGGLRRVDRDSLARRRPAVAGGGGPTRLSVRG